MKRRGAHDLYRNRPLVDAYPGLERLEAEYFEGHFEGSAAGTQQTLRCLRRLLGTNRVAGSSFCVVGCGPSPKTVRTIRGEGCRCVGVEPVPSFADAARAYLKDPDGVQMGAAEALPYPDGAFDILLMESVLEHVESPERALEEAFRCLKAGGVLFVGTTNRYRLTNGEFRVRFYQWLPATVKESFVFQHLHFNPSLADFTRRPAVHWFTYASLCRLGRRGGFYRFYSKLDLLESSDPGVTKSRLRRMLLDRVRYNPWLRSAALTQVGGDCIFMVKRSTA